MGWSGSERVWVDYLDSFQDTGAVSALFGSQKGKRHGDGSGLMVAEKGGKKLQESQEGLAILLSTVKCDCAASEGWLQEKSRATLFSG